MRIAERLIPALKQKGMTDVLVIMGALIPEVDFRTAEEDRGSRRL